MEGNEMNKSGAGKTCGSCGCGCHKVVPISIILIGLAFLLQAFDVLSASVVSIAWPILVIIIGGMKLASRACKCC